MTAIKPAIVLDMPAIAQINCRTKSGQAVTLVINQNEHPISPRHDNSRDNIITFLADQPDLCDMDAFLPSIDTPAHFFMNAQLTKFTGEKLSVSGFCLVDKLIEETGDNDIHDLYKEFMISFHSELATLQQWLNGWVYDVTVYDKDGKVIKNVEHVYSLDFNQLDLNDVQGVIGEWVAEFDLIPMIY